MAVIEKIVEVNISTITIGDTIICNDGFKRTVSKDNIKKDPLFGITVFGDSYKIGNMPIKKVIYEKQ